MRYRLGVDVGGTFTDFILVDEERGTSYLHKTPSTPGDPSIAVLDGWRALAARATVDAAEVGHVMHGTTVGTNTLLEQRGARVGLLTTSGFREILHLARGQTPPPYGMWIQMVKPDPLADLRDTREIDERIGADGAVIKALDEDQVRAHISALVRAGIESLTVCLVNAFVNPEHEHRIGEIAREIEAGLPVSLSSDVLPEFREYQRALTTVVNAYVKPRMETYLTNLGRELAKESVVAPVNVIRSDGGLMSLDGAVNRPVQTILSGPAGGVAGATYLARQAGFDNILTFDMGGTSTDVSLVRGGQPAVGRDLTVGYYEVRTPALLIHTVGAGGGSIAHVPALTRALRVGPQSAGADPGPAAYGKGGTQATVTDANVVLGHLRPSLLGGEFILDRDKAHAAVAEIAEAIGLETERAAQGILDIVNENMYAALRTVSIQRGHDPREFALFAFGGAGPLHANALAKLMDAWPVIIPPAPGVLCAQGHVSTSFRNEFARTYIRRFDRIDVADLRATLEALGVEATEWLDGEGVPTGQREIKYEIDVRYYRQGSELTIATNPDELGNLEKLVEQHSTHHEQLYGFRLDALCETVNLRAIALGRFASVNMPETALAGPDASGALLDEHPVYFDGAWVSTPHYDRARLVPGNQILGPAVVEQTDSTTLVLPGHTAEVDRFENILIWPVGHETRTKGNQ